MSLKEEADQFKSDFERLREEISKVIVGQQETIELVLTAVFCGGHCLLVGVPGLAKTLLVQTVASALDLHFNRIQFTPDLMPSDIIGSETLNTNREFQFVKGPIFANIILADEINRTPPKTQSALLEAMQEHAVTVSGKHYILEEPFFVLATQNPIEQEGTYPLPEAQLDRFMFNILLNYPDYEAEINIVKNTTGGISSFVEKILSGADIVRYGALIRKVPVSDHVMEYAVGLVHKTRSGTARASKEAQEYLEWGAGPRASQYLILGAKCRALISGKYSPDIEDVEAVALPVLRHRIVRNFKAEAEGISSESIIQKMF